MIDEQLVAAIHTRMGPMPAPVNQYGGYHVAQIIRDVLNTRDQIAGESEVDQLRAQLIRARDAWARIDRLNNRQQDRIALDQALTLDFERPATTSPKRIQLRRTGGWHKPEDAIVVARPTKYGNPFIVGTVNMTGPDVYDMAYAMKIDRALAVALFRRWNELNPELVEQATPILRGHDLACWCPLDEPCHADVWLELVNR